MFSVGFGEHITPTFDVESAVEQFRRWARECDSEHSRCQQQNNSSTTLPRRVLDLAITDDERSLKLIESNGIVAKYTTLSRKCHSITPVTGVSS